MMTKSFEQKRKPSPLKSPEEWPNMMVPHVQGFSLRYLLPRRWWPKYPGRS